MGRLSKKKYVPRAGVRANTGRPPEDLDLLLLKTADHELEMAGIVDLTPALLQRLLQEKRQINTAIRRAALDFTQESLARLFEDYCRRRRRGPVTYAADFAESKTKVRYSVMRPIRDRYIPNRRQWLKAAARWRAVGFQELARLRS
jgi:hypothetical protein